MIKENQIEYQFIEQLVGQKYKLASDIVDRKTLEANFKQKFEQLNRVRLTDNEFLRLREEIIEPDVFLASKKLREQQYFQREDGTPLHYTLVNIKDWCKNEFEVINQLRINTENSHQRYDVILLLNGLPLIQIELKKHDISPRKAMQQIVDYKNEPGNGYGNTLLCFMQLFIVSNRTNTYYFSNNKNKHFSFNADEQFLPVYQLADPENNKITHLTDFSNKFLEKCTLGEMISKYMVLVESEQRILVMRPYQIYAVKNIISCIDDHKGNGYIWHTTGSGKTLTSFKAATILKSNPNIDKCLFVVDRKDLDRQTREEFNKFQEGSVEENTNTETLVRRLLSESYADKVIVTTIQKLGLALDENSKRNQQKAEDGKATFNERLAPLSNKRMVFIFDECHRSQFGDYHQAIKDFFPNSQLFGFTGTPIFEENASYTVRNDEEAQYKTTEYVFEKDLHSYTITHAIEDRNVLKFHVDYYGDEDGEKLEYDTPRSRTIIADAILKKHNKATNQRQFNAVFATSSINSAIAYHKILKDLQEKQVQHNPDYEPLNIACVFSPPAQLIAKEKDRQSQKNAADVKQLQQELAQEREDNKKEPARKKKALEDIIADYNKQFGANHDINEFDLYYQDVQQRIKDQKYDKATLSRKHKIDIVIVVDMLLTGFDSKYLNTLYVDKNLKYHGLIQAFSRTNRVLNDTKPYGNILDFRGQEEAVNQAITLFSGEAKDNPARIWMVDPAPVMIEKYKEAVAKLGDFMQDHDLVCEPEEVYNLKGDAARIGFIKNFKEVQRLKTQLDQYTDLDESQQETIEHILPTNSLMEFKSSYIETAKQLREVQQKEGDEAPAELQQLDFELVLFASAVIDYDYIMSLIADSTQTGSKRKKMSKEQIKSLLRSFSNLMEEEEDLSDFIDSIDWSNGQTQEEIKASYEQFKIEKHNKALAGIAKINGLELSSLKAFTDRILERMIFDGEELTDLLEPLELSWKDRRNRELQLMEQLVPQLKKQAEGREISGLAAYE